MAPRQEMKPKITEMEEEDDDGEISDSERIDVDNLENQPLQRTDMARLEGIMKDWKSIQEKVNGSHRHIIDAVPHLVEFTQDDDNDTRDKGVKNLDLLLRDLHNLSAEMSSHKESIDEIYQKIVQGEDIADTILRYESGVTSRTTEYETKTSRQKYGQDGSTYLKFKQSVFESRDPDKPAPPMSSFIPREDGDISDDDDFEMGTVTQDYKCPITLKVYDDPMVSPCGHYFSKDGLRMMLSNNNKQIRCPSTGCTTAFGWTDCKPDPDMAKKVKTWKRREERKKDTQGEEIID